MSRLSWRSRALGVAAALSLGLPAVTGAADATASAASATGAPITLRAPQKVIAYGYKGRVWTDLGLRVVAQGAPFELWSNRASYDDPIETVWRSATGDVTLPAGSMKDFDGLHRFLSVTLTPRNGGDAITMKKDVCLDGWAERVQPEAPATSPYPHYCGANPYSIGSVQGIQQGWATQVLGYERPLRLAYGTYDATVSIAPRYAEVFGLTAAESTRMFTLVVKRESEGNYRPAARPAPVARPAAHEPTQAALGAPTGPVPDLRALPAFAIRVGGDGNHLQFAANVWNAGDSPMVVDGFRREGEDTMDAYQYFFDGDGNQTGYQQVGQMHWDPRSTHHHWHFEDFARYVLLKKDMTEAVRSKKEAFCLANTDAVDTTVPNAAWKPENTDLSTSCGGYDALSVREVLSSGWGDTYMQFRAGQSFDLEGVPNGTYYIAVQANPNGNLVESATDNNQSLRKVYIRGTRDNRTVVVPQVGIVEEPSYGR